MCIRVILMDVDGTLTTEDKKISKVTKRALMKAQSLGIRLVLASGRPTSGLMDLAKELEMDKNQGLLICFNGSQVVDCASGEVLFNQTMTIDQGQKVLNHLKHFKDAIPMINKEDYMYVSDVYHCMIDYHGPYNVVLYEARGGKFKLCEVDDLASFANFPLNKILVAASPSYLKEHYMEMYEPFKEDINGMFTAPFYFEFTAQGVDKARAMNEVLGKMGYRADEMMAFGDGHNDVSMLQYAKYGIAMGNAVSELKQLAYDVTDDNNHDGIAKALEKYVF